VVDHSTFEAAVVGSIALSAFLLATPDPPPGPLLRTMRAVETAVTFLFAVEALLKLVARGVAGYLRSKTDSLDLFVATVSLVDESVGWPLVKGGFQSTRQG
jgi:hypothetical protein